MSCNGERHQTLEDLLDCDYCVAALDAMTDDENGEA